LAAGFNAAISAKAAAAPQLQLRRNAAEY